MSTPAIILIVLLSLNLLATAANDGRPRKNPNYDFPATLIDTALLVGLLLIGGFFK